MCNRHVTALGRRLRRESRRQGRPATLRSGELLLPVLRRRLALSALMAAVLAVLCAFVARYELNAINASLGNFLVAALAGCLFESMLATCVAVTWRLRGGYVAVAGGYVAVTGGYIAVTGGYVAVTWRLQAVMWRLQAVTWRVHRGYMAVPPPWSRRRGVGTFLPCYPATLLKSLLPCYPGTSSAGGSARSSSS